VNVIAYDYRGYGVHHHHKTPNEASCYADVEAVYQFLLHNDVPANSIVLYGRSLGSGPTIHLASTLWSERTPRNNRFFSGLWCTSVEIEEKDDVPPPIAGVILQSPITSCVRVISNALATLPIDMFVNINKIDQIESEIIIIHGNEDVVVPFEHGKLLSEKTKHLWRFVDLQGAGHNNIECDFLDQLVNALVEYLGHLREERQEK